MATFRSLEQRTATDGARPLLTWYHPDSGGRVEFSAISFANWVDKTINLLTDLGWGSAAGDEDFTVAAPLLLDRPAHWVSVVWAMTVWQSGGRIRVSDDRAGAEVVVLGPDQLAPSDRADTIACSLHPLGLGLPAPVAGVIDYREVLSQPDLHTPATAEPGRDWIVGGGLPTWQPSSARVMLQPVEWTTALTAVAAAVDGGGSVVLIDGPASAEQLARIAADEKIEHEGSPVE